MRSDLQMTFDQVNYDKAELVIHDVKVSGDLAVARGASEAITTPKTGGEASHTKGKRAVYQRQPAGSWRCVYDILNRDQPAPGKSAGAIEEKALLQIERDWTAAEMKADTIALDKILAASWTNNEDGQVTKKPRFLLI